MSEETGAAKVVAEAKRAAEEHVRRLEAALRLACLPERELIALAQECGFEADDAGEARG